MPVFNRKLKNMYNCTTALITRLIYYHKTVTMLACLQVASTLAESFIIE